MSEGDQPANRQEEEAGRPQIGAVLEKRRREKGLSLKDVEQATKIRTRYLEGLEREDYSLLPDAVYARGFLKTYANFLGLDGEQLADKLRASRAPRQERHQQAVYGDQASYEEPRGTRGSERPLLTPGGSDTGRRRGLSTTVRTVVLALLVLAAVAGVLYFIGSREPSQPSDSSDYPAEHKAAQEQQSAAGGETTSSPAESTSAGGETTSSRGVEVVVRTIGGSSGLTIYADGAVAYDGIAQPGFAQTFSGSQSVTVSARNSGVVEIEVNGRDLGRLGNNGQPKTQTFTPSSSGT